MQRATRAVKNIVVIGASYGGAHVAEVLAKGLPKNHRVILVDKNSHFNHIYRFVRFGVLPGHEAKVFIPYTNVLTRASQPEATISEHHCPKGSAAAEISEYARSIFIQAKVVNVTKKYVEVDRTLCEVDGITENCVVEHEHPIECGAYKKAAADGTLEEGFNCMCLNGSDGPISNKNTTKVRYDYLVFATGSIMPRPLLSNSRTKEAGMHFLQGQQDVIRRAKSILIVGGGALGVQYATDIADLYKDKKITLVHSRERLLPHFEEEVHKRAVERMRELGIEMILGDRMIMPEGHVFEGKELDHRILKTQKGREIESDLQLFCTGQSPNTSLVKNVLPNAVGKDGYIKVNRHMQVQAPGHRVPHIFAIGDCIDGFGAIKAGHTAWHQATVAANNIVTIVKARENGEKTLPQLEEYTPGKPMISVSLGLTSSVKQLVDEENNLKITSHTGEQVDAYWEVMWDALGIAADDPFI
ncbi:FAD/NAD(P)-binding domain-containing protein [Cystobasidium minutum MCA 4210]|uniref:FAD/NAD(P)-binding domain-containing protein n=1 Tax=Cystobasidium minutum MCA 4210 TaxID=1397322 RepID=UPI0034CE4757|eukprot:jgi/Rhomi1/164164/estExt_Genewise1Plus.C_100179